MQDDDDHPLLRKNISRIDDWTTWRERWQAAPHVEELMGLLHVAPHVAARDPANRREAFDFLLKVADGWRAERFLGSRSDAEGAYRQDLAEKAFKTLSEYGFHRRQPGDEMQPEWLRFWLAEPLYFGLLRFLDDGERRDSLLTRNLSYDPPSKHHEVWARDFALALIAKTWDIENNARGIFYASEEVSKMTWRRHCAKARPRYVRILHGLGRLDLLTAKDLWMDEGSEEHRVLKALALQNPYIPNEAYASMHEALMKGWQASHVLTVVEATMRARRARR